MSVHPNIYYRTIKSRAFALCQMYFTQSKGSLLAERGRMSYNCSHKGVFSMADIANNIRRLRQQHQMTQTQLAEKMALSQLLT